MTREKAIKILNTVLAFGRCDCQGEEINECLKMAIQALGRQKWNKYDDEDPNTWPKDGSWGLWQHKNGGMNILRWKQDAQNHFYPNPCM